MQPLDDVALVRRVVRGRDEQAFRRLYRAHTPAMLAVAWRLLDRDRTETEDAVQDAWVVAMDKLEGFRWESTLQTWLVGIALNCARNRARKRMRTVGHDVDLASVAELPAPAPIASTATRVDVERAVARLPEGYREVLVLHDVFGYTHDEIGRMLGVESGTSKSQLARARGTLRRWLGEKGNRHHERRSE